jgi:ABC-type antimicrobial peptide transport system permease subunit
MVTDELKAMQSNPNMNMVDQNYKNRIIQPNVPISINNNNNPQLVNKNRPVPTLQSSFINKMPNNNNPFDSDQIIKNTQHQQQQQQQQVQKPNIPPTKPILASNAQQKQSQPHLIPHQQQQRPITQMGVNTTNNFDHVNRQLPQNLSSTEQAMLLKQQQRNQQFNANVVNSLKNINQVNNKPMTSSQSSQIQTMKSMQSSQTAAAAVAGAQTTTSNPNLKPTNKNNLISPTNPNNLNPNNNNNNNKGFNQFNNTNRPNNISPQRQQQPNHTTVNMHPNYQLSNFQKSGTHLI